MSGFVPPNLRELAQEVSQALIARKETVSVLETAAGGLISASLLSLPGASAVYKGGITVYIPSHTYPTSSSLHGHWPEVVPISNTDKGYSLESRVAFADWTPADIENYTGPNTEIVGNLASHVCRTLNSTYGVSESGTAGPTGGSTRTRTPGYVAVAVSTGHGTYTREVDTGSNDREQNMVAFAIEALKLLKEVLLK